MHDFEWSCPIEAAEGETGEDPLVFGGTAIVSSDLEIGKNGWGVPDEELKRLTTQFSGIQLRKNHGKLVDDIVGKIRKANYENGKIGFIAELHDSILAKKVKNGLVTHTSICATAKEVSCSLCGKPTRPIRACKCEDSHELIRDLRLKELSLVAEPAFESAKIVPLSFSAAVNEALRTETQKPAVEDSQQKGETKMVEAPKDAPVVSATEQSAPPEPPKKEEEAKKEEATRTTSMGTDSIALLAEDLKTLIRKQDESAQKMQLFWEELPKKMDQMFWERAKKQEEEAKKEEAVPPPKKEEECKKEEISVPPEMKKKESEEEDEEASVKEDKKPLQAATDISQDTVKSDAPRTPEELWASVRKEILEAGKKFEIV